MNNQSLDQLMRVRASAKKKLILGIVFTAVAYFFSFIGLLTMSGGAVGVVLVILSLPFYGVGIPFLIKGIIGTIKANRQIALARMNGNSAPAQPVVVQQPTPQQPVIVAQPVPVAQQPIPQPVVQQTIPAAPQPVAPQPVFTEQPPVQPIASEPVQEQQAAGEEKASGCAELDWQKYNPLDAGISYNKDKDYKFHRADGFAGSVPQKFVDRTFPKCPICCSKEPHWTISQHNQMSWKGNLYLFKCSSCESIISMSMPDVTTLGNGASGIVSNPNVGLTNLMVKAKSGKEAGAVYAVIESVGTSGVSRECEGKEFKLEHLQDMFLR